MWLHVTKEAPGGAVSEWTVETSGDHRMFRSPNGVVTEVPYGTDVLEALHALTVSDPDVAVLYRNQRVRIACADAVRDVLPLWLRPSREEVPGQWTTDGHFTDDWECSNLDLSHDHDLTVNGERWWVLVSEPYGEIDPEERLLAIPVGGCSPDELAQVLAEYTSTETAGMIGGWFSSTVGLLTSAVIMMIDVYDEVPALISISPFTNPVQAVTAWLESGDMTNYHRSRWRAAGVESDFIIDGFRRLADAGGASQITAWGLYDEDSMFGEGGVQREGLSDTTKWTFYGSLTSSQWVEVLAAVP